MKKMLITTLSMALLCIGSNLSYAKTTTSLSNSGEYKTCEEVRNDYISAVNQIKDLAQRVQEDLKIDCSKKQSVKFNSKLCQLINAVQEGDYSHPTLMGYYSAIKSGAPTSETELMTKLDGQVTSAGKRVDKWKDTKYFPNLGDSCKNVCGGCDLGQQDSLCSSESAQENKECTTSTHSTTQEKSQK